MNEQVFLGFDVGLSKMGVAVGQGITKTAKPLKILSVRSGTPNWSEMEHLVAEWQPAGFVVGVPPFEDKKAPYVKALKKAVQELTEGLKQRFLKPVYLWDEHLSTRLAHSAIEENSFLRRKHSEHVDDIAAQIILESWLRERT